MRSWRSAAIEADVWTLMGAVLSWRFSESESLGIRRDALVG